MGHIAYLHCTLKMKSQSILQNCYLCNTDLNSIQPTFSCITKTPEILQNEIIDSTVEQLNHNRGNVADAVRVKVDNVLVL